MNIARFKITRGMDGLPVISQVVEHAGIVYTCGVTPDPVGDIVEQTQQVLARIDRLLHEAGTEKSRLLTAQVWLADMRMFEAHNAAWNAWVDQDSPPTRVCVQAKLWRPNMLVEVAVTAAAKD